MWTGLLDERNSRQHYTDLRREAYVERLFKRTDRGDATWKEGIRLRLLLALILLVSLAWLGAWGNPTPPALAGVGAGLDGPSARATGPTSVTAWVEDGDRGAT